MTSEKGNLDGAIGYLIGPIDRVADQGKGWRKDFKNKCRKRDIEVKILDPTNKVATLKKEVDEEQTLIREMKENEEWDKLSEFMFKVVRGDHRSIDIGDFVVCYIDIRCHMCGSYFELRSALSQKKPYFIFVEGGKKNTPSWLFGIVDHNKIFNSVDEIVDHLEQLNDGRIPMDDRWVLIRDEIKNL